MEQEVMTVEQMEMMIWEHFDSMTVDELKGIATELALSVPTVLRKQEIIDAIIEEKKAEATVALNKQAEDEPVTGDDVLTWVCINLELITEEPKPQYVIDHEEKIAEKDVQVSMAAVRWIRARHAAKNAKADFDSLGDQMDELLSISPQPPEKDLFNSISDDKKDAARKQGEEALNTCPDCEGRGHIDGDECEFCQGEGKVPPTTNLNSDDPDSEE